MLLVGFSILTYTLNIVSMQKNETVKSTCQGIVAHRCPPPLTITSRGSERFMIQGLNKYFKEQSNLRGRSFMC